MGQLLLAYHGCDISTRDALIRGELQSLTPSSNCYDWLGKGIYFFLDDHERALRLATHASKNTQQLLTKRPIVSPAVIGCVLEVDRCLDLSTEAGRRNFSAAAQSLQAAADQARSDGKSGKLPVNKPAFPGDNDTLHRAYDCAVLTMLHQLRAIEHKDAISAGDSQLIANTLPFQATKSVFRQGEPLMGSCIYDGTHSQIALHDNSCIRGWFLLPGEKLLTDHDFAQAKASVDAAIQQRIDRKQRVRALA